MIKEGIIAKVNIMRSFLSFSKNLKREVILKLTHKNKKFFPFSQ
jgi:hypothetical protein